MSDHIVTFKARETPSNESSTVLIEHELHISEKSRSGNQITWTIDKLTFDQPGGGDWTHDSPGLGDWKTTHANIAAPVASEFNHPPAMSGTAANDGAGSALTYAFTAGTCDVDQSQMFGGNVTCAVYSYVAADTIAEEVEKEPAETDLEDDPD